jgi:hypothetical protein
MPRKYMPRALAETHPTESESAQAQLVSMPPEKESTDTECTYACTGFCCMLAAGSSIGGGNTPILEGARYPRNMPTR